VSWVQETSGRHVQQGSPTASRQLLRKVRSATANPATQQRNLAEREAVILDKMIEFAQALFSYDSVASHADPHLRDNAVLELGTAASLAQLIFART
jgi:hypothetical protein